MDSARALLAPTFLLVAAAALVWAIVLYQRVTNIARRRVSPQRFATRTEGAQHGAATAASDNLLNLFEVPVLYYTLVAVLLATGRADATFTGLAWAFAGLRLLHSTVHVTYNRVTHRFALYVLSSVALWIAWLRLAWLILIAG